MKNVKILDIKERIKKNEQLRKLVLYGISGVITTGIAFATFKIFLERMDYILAFSLSWLIAVIFAYFLTRKRVYSSKAKGKAESWMEFLRFVLGRIFTYAVNLLLLMFAVEILKLDEFCSNVVITIIVVILNYFVGDIMINKLKKKII